MSELEIIGVPFSNYVRSVRMLCEEKGVRYKLTPSRPHTPEVLAIHPAGQVPVMRHGEVALFESKAIATYVDKAFPGPKFIPDDAVGAARVEQWVSYGNAKVDHWIMRQFVVPQVFFDKAKGPDMAKISAAMPEIEKCCAALQGQVGRSRYLAGETLTYADLHLLPMLVWLKAFPAGQEIAAKFAPLMAYVAKLEERPSFVATTPPPRG